MLERCVCHAGAAGGARASQETSRLDFVRDVSGATTINQYVVVKTLGRGAFGKVKLCLNTLDGRLYAVKVRRRGRALPRRGSAAATALQPGPPGAAGAIHGQHDPWAA